MTYPATPCRFVRQVGTFPQAIILWGTCVRGQHVARFSYQPTGDPEPDHTVPPGWREAIPPEGTVCEKDCGGAPYLADAPDQRRSGSVQWLYDTPSGRTEPGCLYWVDHSERDWCPGGWSNCDARHLHCVLPNGHSWDVDSRASNCGSRDDSEHRCWVRVGDPEADPPTVQVSKDGLTCAAGAGSIASGDYHGFLRLVDGRSTLTEG